MTAAEQVGKSCSRLASNQPGISTTEDIENTERDQNFRRLLKWILDGTATEWFKEASRQEAVNIGNARPNPKF